jgi:hypothetical protein
MRSVWLGPRAGTLPNSLSHARLLLAVGRTGASSLRGRRVRASGQRLRRRTHGFRSLRRSLPHIRHLASVRTRIRYASSRRCAACSTRDALAAHWLARTTSRTPRRGRGRRFYGGQGAAGSHAVGTLPRPRPQKAIPRSPLTTPRRGLRTIAAEPNTRATTHERRTSVK